MNDPNDYADDGSGSGMPADPTAGLDRTVNIAAPSPPPMYAPPPPIQYGATAAGIPSYVYQTGPVAGGYDDTQTYLTGQRAAYGNLPMMGMRGAYTVGAGAAQGVGQMFGAIGSAIAPISYTPPARVLTDFNGRYVQETGLFNDVRNSLGLGTMMRAAHAGDVRYNASSDLGEKVALGAAGAAMSMANIGIGIGGSMLGGAVLGGVGSIAGGILAPLAASAMVGDRIEEGVAQRREIMNYLETTSDRYVTAGSAMSDNRRGAGFNAGARREITEFVRNMDVKDPMLNTSELTKILKEGTQQGLFTGANSVDDFKKRFKDVVDNVKIVATTLHQTLEEGVKTIHDLRAIGVAPGQVAGVMQRAEAAGLASGRSAGEMVNLGLQGAEMFRGTGVSMQIGFESNMMNAAAIRSARDSKMLSEEAIAQAGGEEALAQRMTASSLGFTQSQTGRGMMGMLFNAGQAGTGFDPIAFSRMVMSGGGDLNANAMQAAKNLSSPGAIVKFQANQEEFASELGKTFGGRGLEIFTDNAIMMQATQLAKVSGASVEDAFKTIAKTQMGLSEAEAQTRLATIKNAPQAFETAQAASEKVWEKTKEDQAAQNFFVTRIGATIGAAVKTATDVVSRPIADTVENVKQGVANGSDYLMGTQRVNLNGTGYDLFSNGRDPSSPAAQKAAKLARIDRSLVVDADGKVTQREFDLDKGGQIGTNAGEALANLIRGGQTGSLDLSPSETGEVILRSQGGLFAGALGESRLLGETAGMRLSVKQLEAAAKIARITTTTLGEAQQLDKDGKIKSERAEAGKGYAAALGSSEMAGAKSANDIVAAVYGKGKTVKDLTKTQYAALLLETQDSPRLAQIFEVERKVGEAVVNADNAVSVASESGNLAAAEDARTTLNDMLNPRDTADKIGDFITGNAGSKGLTPTAMAKLARVNALARDKTASPQALAEAEKAFKAEVGKIGGDVGDKLRDRIPEILNKAKTGDASMDAAFGKYTSNFEQIGEEQQRRGQQVLSRSLEADIFGGSANSLKDEEKSRLISMMDRVGAEGAGAVRELAKDKDSAALLGKTAAGQMLLGESKAVDKLEALGGGKGRDEVVKTLSGTMPSAQVERVADAYAQHQSANDAIAAVHGQTMDMIAGKTNMASAGTTPAASGGPGGTADQNASVQLNINMATLTALRELTGRLVAKR